MRPAFIRAKPGSLLLPWNGQKLAGDYGLGPVKDVVGINSKIASIVIAGKALGDVSSAHVFGFVAQQINAFTLGGTNFPLTPGAGNTIADLTSLGITGTLFLREVAL